MIPATLFRRWKGACSIAETNGSHFSLQGIAHTHWLLVSLDIHRVMHENLNITFLTFPCRPFFMRISWFGSFDVLVCIHYILHLGGMKY